MLNPPAEPPQENTGPIDRFFRELHFHGTAVPWTGARAVLDRGGGRGNAPRRRDIQFNAIGRTAAPEGECATRREGLMRTAAPCAIVIFGASGDLSKLKLVPAIYEMLREGLLADKFVLVGYSRSKMTDDEYRKDCFEAISKNARHKPIDEAMWKKMEQNVFYVAGNYDSAEDHARARRAAGGAGQDPPDRRQPAVLHLDAAQRVPADHHAARRARAEAPERRGVEPPDHRKALRPRPGQRRRSTSCSTPTSGKTRSTGSTITSGRRRSRTCS